MQIGDVIQDSMYPADRGIILIHDKKNCEYYVLAFNGNASWFQEKYINKCKVIG